MRLLNIKLLFKKYNHSNHSNNSPILFEDPLIVNENKLSIVMYIVSCSLVDFKI